MPVFNSQALNLSRTEAAERARIISVHDYHVTVDLRSAVSAEADGFTTQSIITFSAVPGESSFLDFVGSSVQRVNLNGRELPIDYQGARIALPDLQAENQVLVTATAQYSRSGEGLHRYLDPADGKIYLYTQYEPADARRVFANFEQPDLKGRYRIEVIAPSHWQVASNGAAEAVSPLASAPDLSRWVFAATEPISSYITCILAGEYARFESHWSGVVEVPLAAYCRASMAASFDAEQVFELTKRGLDYFHGLFDFAYPFGKYDQAFVPEYNLGAMENPGLVTFSDGYVFTSRATEMQYEQRANTLLHEMAHMWFGDLVTMRWWDDLWLKESFADYMGTLAVAETTDWGAQSWVNFANRRKGWAYVQDQLPSTHPIVADIVDLEAAKQNFDGITYAKGASVLKQLVAFVGPEAFFSAARKYFQDHAFGNTTLQDFLTALAGATRDDASAAGRDMDAWAAAWLQTAGISTLSAEIESADGRYRRVRIQQQAQDPITGLAAHRPHTLRIGLYSSTADGTLLRTRSVPVEVTGEWTEVPELAGERQAELLLLNDDDLSYAKVRLDPESLRTVLGSLDRLDDPLASTLCWSALWNMTRDAVLPAADFVGAVRRFASVITKDGVLATLLDNARIAVQRLSPAGQRPELLEALLQTSMAQARTAIPGSGVQLAWMRSLALLARDSTSANQLLHDTLAGQGPDGLAVDSDLRWRLLQALSANGSATLPELAAELATDKSSTAAIGYRCAAAARPEAPVKAAVWSEVVESDSLSNAEISASIEGFRAGPASLLEPYRAGYFEVLDGIWSSRSIEISSRIVRGLFPEQDAEPGLPLDQHDVVRRATDWLADRAEAPQALRRIVIECLDQLQRSLRAQLA